MKKYLLGLLAILMVAVASVSFVSCNSDDDDASFSKSALIGTWYTLEDEWIIVFAESTYVMYEFWENSGVYSLNSYTNDPEKYTISGNKLVSDDGISLTFSVNGNTLNLTDGSETLTYTKFNGTPQQLIDFLNNK